MKKFNNFLRGGEEKYLSPSVSIVEITVEKGFAQSVNDPYLDWGGDISDYE